jgi:hypothetical protein
MAEIVPDAGDKTRRFAELQIRQTYIHASAREKIREVELVC